MKPVRYNLPDNLSKLSDDEIRKIIWDSKEGNSSYVSDVCRMCGEIYNSSNGDARTAIIHKTCETHL